uniref:Uncharacterized protein n=1 Tax=Arundo donax TaxID=35708 RepID=A0A0A9H3T4_ARUDO
MDLGISMGFSLEDSVFMPVLFTRSPQISSAPPRGFLMPLLLSMPSSLIYVFRSVCFRLQIATRVC